MQDLKPGPRIQRWSCAFAVRGVVSVSVSLSICKGIPEFLEKQEEQNSVRAFNRIVCKQYFIFPDKCKDRKTFSSNLPHRFCFSAASKMRNGKEDIPNCYAKQNTANLSKNGGGVVRALVYFVPSWVGLGSARLLDQYCLIRLHLYIFYCGYRNHFLRKNEKVDV